MDLCYTCGNNLEALLNKVNCTTCDEVYYCSRFCKKQQKHSHSKSCKKVRNRIQEKERNRLLRSSRVSTNYNIAREYDIDTFDEKKFMERGTNFIYYIFCEILNNILK